MLRRALLAAVCLSFVSVSAVSILADEIESQQETVFTPPPAPAEADAVPAPPVTPDEPGSAQVSETPPEPEKRNEPISVPVPHDPIETLPEPENPGREITIRIGPKCSEVVSELTDFSDTRFWPGQGGIKWMPGHRDRFGMLSFTGESAVRWEDWGNLTYLSGYGFHFLNGPVQTDLPSKVFDFTWGLHWSGEIMEDWSASMTGRVGIFTDFEDSARDGWRFPADAVVLHDWTETVRGVGGVKYLDRENLPALPVFGVILRPVDTFRLEAVFPEPRIAIKVFDGVESDNWLTLSGEIGGGEWAIERANTDLADVVTYNDYSAVLGFHHYNVGQSTHAFEVGYTFVRDLEYRSGMGDFEPEESFFLRWSGHY